MNKEKFLPKKMHYKIIDDVPCVVDQEGKNMNDYDENDFEVLLKEMLTRYNAHNTLVKALKTLYDMTFADAILPSWSVVAREITEKALKEAGEEV